MSDYFSDKKEDYDIDLSSIMYGAKIFDNGIFFIDFGPVPVKTKKIVKINETIFPCHGECFHCDYYKQCRLEDL